MNLVNLRVWSTDFQTTKKRMVHSSHNNKRADLWGKYFATSQTQVTTSPYENGREKSVQSVGWSSTELHSLVFYNNAITQSWHPNIQLSDRNQIRGGSMYEWCTKIWHSSSPPFFFSWKNSSYNFSRTKGIPTHDNVYKPHKGDGGGISKTAELLSKTFILKIRYIYIL